jgi:ATP-dependent RNA helicase DDX55/SPB4
MANVEVKRKANSTKRLEQKKKNLAWSEKVTAKEERDMRREKKAKKRVWLKTNTGESTQSERANVEDRHEGLEGLAKEERLVKKRKKGLEFEEEGVFTDL